MGGGLHSYNFDSRLSAGKICKVAARCYKESAFGGRLIASLGRDAITLVPPPLPLPDGEGFCIVPLLMVQTTEGAIRDRRKAVGTKRSRKTPSGVFLLLSFAREARRTAPS